MRPTTAPPLRRAALVVAAATLLLLAAAGSAGAPAPAPVAAPKAAAAATTAPKAAAAPPATTTPAALAGPALDAALAAAEDAQDWKEPAPAPVTARLTTAAPAAVLPAGTGDLATDGPCEAELDARCDTVRPGGSRLYECLMDAVAESEGGGKNVGDKAASATTNAAAVADAAAAGRPPLVLSKTCAAAATAFASARSHNVNADVPLASTCGADIAKHCADARSDGLTTVLGCLREVKADLAPPCAALVRERQVEATRDLGADAELADACAGDAGRLCAGLVGPAVPACLRAAPPGKLSWECREEVFRVEVEAAGDLSLSGRVFAACLGAKKAFCADVPPGNGRAIACLEAAAQRKAQHAEHAATPFPPACKAELDALAAKRATDFRLDPALRTACAADADALCGWELDEVADRGPPDPVLDAGDAPVIACLQDFREELKEPACQAAVHATIARGAADIRADPPFAAACSADRARLCGSVPPGSAAVIRCLSQSRAALSPACGAMLFDTEVRMAESLDFQAPLRAACGGEAVCRDVPRTKGAAIRCLQDELLAGGTRLSPGCKAAVAGHTAAAAVDYRLNFRLQAACEKDVTKHCAAACVDAAGHTLPADAPCGGAVLRCLTGHIGDLDEAGGCAAEVGYFLKMGVADYHNDVLVAEACRPDVEAHCAAMPAQGVHACLDAHAGELGAACRAELAERAAARATSLDLVPGLASACAAERDAHCAGVRSGKGRVLACLIGAADAVSRAEEEAGGDDGATTADGPRAAEVVATQETLAAAAAATPFSDACSARLTALVTARQADWRRDGGLRAACSADVAGRCGAARAEDVRAPGGRVSGCLASAAVEGTGEEGGEGGAAPLAPACASEAARALRAALTFYSPQAPLTAACDGDVLRVCAARAGLAGVGPGSVLRCLSAAAAPPPPKKAGGTPPPAGRRRRLAADQHTLAAPGGLAPACAALVSLAADQGVDAYASFEGALAAGAVAGAAAAIEARLGLKAGTLTPLSGGVAAAGHATGNPLTLTGWAAVAGLAGLAALLLGGVALTVGRRSGCVPGRGYTHVTKGGGGPPGEAAPLTGRPSV